jgi:hypothetical protein
VVWCVQLHNSRIGSANISAVQTFRQAHGKWASTSEDAAGLYRDYQPSRSALTHARKYVAADRSVHCQLIDLDDHLADVSKKWIDQKLPAF